MSINPGMMSSNSDKWATPQWFFDIFNERYCFTIDVCALPENTKCKKYFSPQDDGLKQKWDGVCWMNPPYGLVIKHWVKKAHESAKDGALVVGLLPARTDTRWFWEHVRFDTRFDFIKGRLAFGNDGKHPAPFPSMVAVWEPTTDDLAEKERMRQKFDLSFVAFSLYQTNKKLGGRG